MCVDSELICLSIDIAVVLYVALVDCLLAVAVVGFVELVGVWVRD